MKSNDKNEIWIESNNTVVFYREDKTVTELFERQIESTPDEIAIICDHKSFTYQQLNERANQVGRILRNEQIGPDDFVVILAERSLEMAIAIYGVIKSGGAYVPIDPSLPQERIQYMIEDCNAKVILTAGVTYHSNNSSKVMDLSEILLMEAETKNLPLIAKPQNLLYCIYTSGTTGRPKGVMLQHRNVVNYCNNNSFNVYGKAIKEEHKKIISVTTMAFDIFVTEMIMPLLHGMTVILTNDKEQNSEEAISRLIKENQVDVMQTTPSKMKLYMINTQRLDYLKQLKVILLGGEQVPIELCRSLRKYTDASIYNVYGPTETTVWSTICKVEDDATKISIGKPIANTKIYIMKDNKLCGVGVPGELCIAGAGLSRGYLNNKELTEDKFTDSPFDEGKIYHTGDLGSWLPDGTIECMGRMDDQVKVRGNRIELGEIESVIKQNKDIRDAVATVRKDSNNENVIFAYVVADRVIDFVELRNEIRKKLPEYMIPSYIMQIDQIPLSGNGKVNRKALPQIKTEIYEEYVEPKTEDEKKLAGILASQLKIEWIGMKDNFFTMGFHSIIALRVINQIEAEFGISISIREIFNYPTIESLLKLIQCCEHKQYSVIGEAEKKKEYLLSPAQKNLYYAEQLDQTGVAYNETKIFKIHGALDISKLQKAIDDMVQRHESLRTSFQMKQGEVVQVIAEGLCHIPVTVKKAYKSEKELISEFVCAFELSNAPLFRVEIVKYSEIEFLLLLDMHHIIADGMSTDIFLHELSELYNGEELPALHIQYKDYSEWFNQRNFVQDQSYWEKVLEGDIPVLNMQYDYQRPQVQGFSGRVLNMKISSEIKSQVEQLAKQTNTTDYMIFLSCVMLMLGTYCKQNDIIVGSPVSGRLNSDTDSLIGMLVNTIPLRCQYNEGDSYKAFLEKVKNICLNAYEHQEYPLERMIQDLGIKRDLSRNPLFDILYVFENDDAKSFHLEQLQLDEITVENNISKFDISIYVKEKNTGYDLVFEYCDKLYKTESITRMMQYFVYLLEQVIFHPSMMISEVKTISEDEAKLLNYFNDSKFEHTTEQTIMDVFEEQVRQHPDDVCVVYEDKSITFVELNKRANQLARMIRTYKITADDFVGIICERSIEMVIGIYAILKAGAAYIPIDSTYPEERIAYICSDAKPKVILSDGTVRLPDVQIPVVYLKTADLCNYGDSNLNHISGPNNLAYCIYTSGTTGQPKGVMNEHHALLNLVSWLQYKYPLEKDDVILQKTAYVFDVSVSELFWGCVAGSKLVMLKVGGEKDPREIIDTIDRYHVSMIDFVPSMLNMFMQVIEDKYENILKLSSLKYVISAGEQLNQIVVNKFYEIAKQYGLSAKLLNCYGPTESAVYATHCLCSEKDDKVMIGKPIGNYQIYIMNGDKLCGFGIPGELCIAGKGVARGYLNHDELTKEKFVKDPYSTGRMYRSGDLARWLSDGKIEYLGRLDEQIKIRGFRIELGEIESVIRQIEEIKDVAVVTKKDNNDDFIICAYYVAECSITSNEIKTIIRKKLPDYMIPGWMLQMDALPVTRNGKLDKRALPEVDIPAIQSQYIAPRNEVEQVIIDIYQEVLNIHQIGVKDNFFAIGGHSLRATKAINRIGEKLGIYLPIKAIFEHPVVEDLVASINEYNQGESFIIPKAVEKKYYKISSAQEQIFMSIDYDETEIAYNLPAAFELTGTIDVQKIQQIFNHLIQRHEALRTTFHIIDNKPVQQILEHVEGKIEYEEVDSDVLFKDMAEQFIRPFVLSQAPLMRMKVIKQGEKKYFLLIDLHHIISDGMTTNIIKNEFNRMYNNEKLHEMLIQYKDYSEWINQIDIQNQQEYWLNVFNGEIPILEFPLDYPRNTIQSYCGNVIRSIFDDNLKAGIVSLAEKTRTTEYIILLSVFMILLGRYSDQEDIIVGSPVSGRKNVELESTMGVFVHSLVMRGRPEKDKNFLSFVDEMKEYCLKAYENQDYPYQELIQSLDLERDTSRNPLFDVLFVLQNNEEKQLVIDGVQVKELRVPINTSKFDFSIYMTKLNGGYLVELEYCTNLFREDSMKQLILHYKELLNSVIVSSNCKISELNMLTQQERSFLVDTCNHTMATYPKDKTIAELLEKQVEKTPNELAIICDHQSFTYCQLNEKANQIGRILRSEGIRPDDFVVILGKRSIEIAIAIYGVIKSGGAYVPVDSALPTNRIQYMIEDCNAKVVITIGTTYQTENSVKVLNLSELLLTEKDNSNLPYVGNAQNLLYCIYTSGTTGHPKGVMLQQRSVVNYCSHNAFNIYGKAILKEHKRIISVTTMSFDIFVTEMILPLLHGMTVVMTNGSKQDSQKTVAQLIKDYQIDVIQTTPSKMRLYIADSENLDYLNTLKVILLGGEQVPIELCKKLREYTDALIYNVYGPTETTVWSTITKIEDHMTQINIGKPIANTQIYILKDKALCGIGVPGELCIAGDGLAKGYLHNKKLTNEKFTDNPLADGIIYHTGDMARWLPDGTIDCMGRIDHQVKVRGNRIELGEIESVMKKNQMIHDVVAVVRKDIDGENAIYSYIVSDQTVDYEKVRSEMRKELPEYMIPSYMMQIDKIPLSTNGKVNRKALPEIKLKSKTEYVAPRDEMEQKLAVILSGILEVDELGMNNNIFMYGFHSIKAIKFINRVESDFGIRLSIRDLLRCHTIANIKKVVQGMQNVSMVSIPKADIKESYPLSSMQKGLFVINMIDDTSIVYNVPMAFQMRGHINIQRIQQAFQQLVERHEILRTYFCVEDGIAKQKIAQYLKVEIDYEKLEKQDVDTIIHNFIKSFHIYKLPLIRLKVVKFTDEEWLLMFDMHHIISDGASLNILKRDFSKLYNGHPLNALKIQYKDFSEWRIQKELGKEKDYWLQAFQQKPPVLELPADYKRQKVQSYNGNMLSRKISKEIREKVEQFSSITGNTEYMIYLSLLMILLSKYSRQKDIVIGTPVLGRTSKDIENTMGMFVNTLIIRAFPEEDKQFRKFQEEIKDTCLKAYENQEYPFEDLVEQMNVKRDISRNPIFNVLFSFETINDEELNLDGIQVSEVKIKSKKSKMDLSVFINKTENETIIDFEYCTDLYKEETVTRMLEHYCNLLEDALSYPEKKLLELSVLSREEAKIIDHFNNTLADYPGQKTVVELFEEQVERTPNQTAIICAEKILTYGQLNEKANQLARKLRKLGVGRNDLVAVYTQRSIEMMIGIYGILKAGGGYVPIGIDYPKERIQFILEDTDAKAILCAGDTILVTQDIPVLDLNESDCYEEEKDNLPHVNKPEDTVYCIFTSGTTGKPKGVINCHIGLINRIWWMQQKYPIGKEDVILQKTTYTFDVSVWEIIWWGFVGAKVVLLPAGGEKNPKTICDTIKQSKVTVIHFVPSMLKMFEYYLISETEDIEKLTSVKYVFSSGEALQKEEVNTFYKLLKGKRAKLTNLYGPTEASIDVTYYDCKPECEKVPIGKPISNTQIYICQGNTLCGIGMPGELCIAGIGVAKGYLNRKELTEEKFVDSPYGKGKMYRTGDLARWLSNGEIEYLGRIDDQVKIRGFRIELREIEEVIKKIPNVTDAIAIVREDSNRDKAIYAYFVANQKKEIKEIRDRLKGTLPDYMVPPYLMQIDKIPVTLNGKLDHRSLPEIKIQSQNKYVIAETEEQRILSQIISEVLDIEQVSIEDNLFDLGMNSMKVIVISIKAKDKGYRLSSRDIMKVPYIKEIVRFMRKL